MLALLLACTGPTATPPAPYAAEVNFTVERGVLSPEEVDIGVAGPPLASLGQLKLVPSSTGSNPYSPSSSLPGSQRLTEL